MNLSHLKPLIIQLFDSMEKEPGDFIAVNWVGNTHKPGLGVPLTDSDLEFHDDDIFKRAIPRLIAVAVIDGLVWHPMGAILTFNGSAIIVTEKYGALAAVLYPEKSKQ